MSDTISRKATIDAMESVDWYHQNQNGEMVHGANSAEHQAWYKTSDVYKVLNEMPSAQPDYLEVLGWLLAYHTKSFDLHGRYFPHEVISWLINDFTKEFIAERKTDGN